MKSDSVLNQRQITFCLGYLGGMAATQAYIAAGYKTRGAAARVNASRMLTFANVDRFIAEHQQIDQQNMQDLRQRTLRQIEAIAFSCINDYIEEVDGRIAPKDILDLHPELLAGLAFLKVSQNRRRISIRLADKLWALDRIGASLGLWSASGRPPNGRGQRVSLPTMSSAPGGSDGTATGISSKFQVNPNRT